MSSLNVAIVTEYYYPSLGGIGEHVHYFSRELVRLGHRATIITSHLSGEEAVVPPPGVQLVRLGRSIPYFANGSFARHTWGWRLTKWLRRFFDEERFNIVHIHQPMVPVLPIIAQGASDGVTVGTLHSYFESHQLSFYYRFFQPMFQHYYDRLDGRIAVSPLCVKSFGRFFHGDIRVIPNGVDVEAFAHGKRLAEFDDDRINIFFLARPDPRSGLDVLIHALPLVCRRHSRVRLIVAGDGPLRRSYEFMAGGLLKQDYIRFVGRIPSEARPHYYATADLFCFPALGGHSFGITILEAMAAGVPIVAADLEAFRRLVPDGEGSLLVPPGDVAGLANALCRLIEDPSLQRRLSESARQCVVKYDWQKVAVEVVKYYEELLAQPAVGVQTRSH